MIQSAIQYINFVSKGFLSHETQMMHKSTTEQCMSGKGSPQPNVVSIKH